jgi:hypothetical protein
MQYKYLKGIIEVYKANPFFDERENKGVSETRISEIRTLVSPYFERIPQVVEEELRLFGEFKHNFRGIDFINRFEAVRDDGVNVREELEKGIWVLSAANFGILTDEKDKLLSQIVNAENLDFSDYDNPSLFNYWEEDNGQLTLTAQNSNFHSSDKKIQLSEYLEINYTKLFENKPHLYRLKQALIEFYSQLELRAEDASEELANKLMTISTKIRGNMGYGISLGRMDEINYQVVKANGTNILELGSNFRTEVELYKIVNDEWNKTKAIEK